MDAEALERRPNTYLKYEREQRGWTQSEVANQLSQLCSEEELDAHGFIDGKRISTWELGKHKPDRFWRKKLSELFGRPAENLGLIEAPQEQVPSSRSGTTFLVSPSIQVIIPNSPVNSDGTPAPIASSPTFISISPQTQTIDAIFAAGSGFPGALLHHQGIDNGAFSAYSHNEREQQLSIHLLLGAGHIAPLLDNGWSPEDILQTINSLAKVVQAMPNMSRQQFLHRLLGAGVATVLGGIPDLSMEKHVSEESRVQLHQALSDSIVSGWKLFHTASNAQTLAVGQAQLALVQQNHALLPTRSRAGFYSSTHNLIGRSLQFQGRHQEALDAHLNAHIAAMSSGDPLSVAQSLICQADSYQVLERPAEAIEAIEEALRVVGYPSDEAQIRIKAHLLACWADNAMTLKDYTLATQKLDESAAYVDQVNANEEFDHTSWLHLSGKLAQETEDYDAAIEYYEEALSELPNDWVTRQALILTPLMAAYACGRYRDSSLSIAEKAVTVLGTLNAPIINNQFAITVRLALQGAFPHDEQVAQFLDNLRQFSA